MGRHSSTAYIAQSGTWQNERWVCRSMCVAFAIGVNSFISNSVFEGRTSVGQIPMCPFFLAQYGMVCLLVKVICTVLWMITWNANKEYLSESGMPLDSQGTVGN